MMINENEPVVAFLLARFPRSERWTVISGLGLNRPLLWHVPGLRFWRLLGVGQGRVFNPHMDTQRSALFTVWDSLADLKRFEQSSKLILDTQRRAEEVWTAHMLPVRWHGTWGGRDPLQHFTPATPPEPGPWLILTRATLYPSKLPAFMKAVPAVAEQLLQQEALINSVGVGELPLLFQATFSLWRTLPDVTSFAYGRAAHQEVIRRTRSDDWYRSELFARFRPIASYGTWDGVNPLPALQG